MIGECVSGNDGCLLDLALTQVRTEGITRTARMLRAVSRGVLGAYVNWISNAPGM